jgi:hypothetical protein
MRRSYPSRSGARASTGFCCSGSEVEFPARTRIDGRWHALVRSGFRVRSMGEGVMHGIRDCSHTRRQGAFERELERLRGEGRARQTDAGVSADSDAEEAGPEIRRRRPTTSAASPIGASRACSKLRQERATAGGGSRYSFDVEPASGSAKSRRTNPGQVSTGWRGYLASIVLFRQSRYVCWWRPFTFLAKVQQGQSEMFA